MAGLRIRGSFVFGDAFFSGIAGEGEANEAGAALGWDASGIRFEINSREELMFTGWIGNSRA